MQEEKLVVLDGRTYERLPYDGADEPCPGCGAEFGQLHVAGCGYERCPTCDGYLVTCMQMEPDSHTKHD
ncbi:hypothetical protein [Desulfovibrio inopinatus]|uniref:hypothetical protein n=1 Tax=Desulfovibrio inopinatus TaxID=102109 RepID=UPI000429C041|nr:hypothetical protein [Desulfovibrio inopinatus]